MSDIGKGAYPAGEKAPFCFSLKPIIRRKEAMGKIMFKRIGLLFISLMVLFAPPSYGDEAKATGSASVSVMSSYVWRGFQLSSDELVIQSSVGVGYKGFSISLWSDYNTGFDPNDLDETDITLDYSGSINKIGYSIGYIYYAFDNKLVGEDTQEVYLGLSYDTFLSPALTLYRDFDEVESTYLSLSIGYDYKVNERLSLSSGASIGYYFYDNFEDDWQNLELSLSTSIPLGPLSISPSIAYSFGLYTGNFGDVDDEIYGGIAVSLNF